jgi:hypothetical protein
VARRSRKLPSGSGGLWGQLVNMGQGGAPKPPFTINWHQTEQAYGNPLSADVRKAVDAATFFFVLNEESERRGEPVTNVHAIIEACRKRATEFELAFPSHKSDEGIAAILFIQKNFDHPRLRDRLFESLHDMLIKFRRACDAAISELTEFPGIIDGDE